MGGDHDQVAWSREFNQGFHPHIDNGIGMAGGDFENVYASAVAKGKMAMGPVMTQESWIKEFEEIKLADGGSSQLHTAWAQEFANVQQNGGIVANEGGQQVGGDDGDWQTKFEDLWQRMKESGAENGLANGDFGNWEKEFRDIMPDSFPSSLLRDGMYASVD